MTSQPLPPVQRVASDTPATIALVLGICGVFSFGLTSVAGAIVAHKSRANTPSRGLSNAALAVCWSVTGLCILVAASLVIPWLLFGGLMVAGNSVGS